MTAEAGRLAFGDFAIGFAPADCEQFKLDRLFELRAVIASLRAERGVKPIDETHASQNRSLAV